MKATSLLTPSDYEELKKLLTPAAISGLLKDRRLYWKSYALRGSCHDPYRYYLVCGSFLAHYSLVRTVWLSAPLAPVISLDDKLLILGSAAWPKILLHDAQ